MNIRSLLIAIGLSTLPNLASAQQLSIATGGTGGAYYPLGGGLAELIGEHVDEANAVAEVTGASVENMGLVWRGDSDIAFALADTVHQAYSGTGDFEGRQLENIRALASVYPNAVQIVTLADSGIEPLSDLEGKTISVGAPGSGTELNARAVLEANGITYDDIDPRRLNFNETADAIRDGDIAAGFWSVGPPTSSIMNLATTRDIRLIGLSDEEIANAQEAEPVFAAYELQADLYEGVDEAVPTLGIPNVLAVSSEMDEELAYQITRTLFEHTDKLIDVHPAANDTTVAFSTESTPIAFHPGALRYYEEIGADVQDHQRP
ncbi:MAG: TAXI family TRAP transporter solute-binding subunit [Pseudomonadota bacterium]